MGRRGPKPTPTATLKARGSRAADRRGAEPKPPPGRPARPDWLDAEAAAKWDELVPELEALGLLTIVDGDCLAAYCVAWSVLKMTTKRLAKEGRVVKTPSGYQQPHPCVSMQHAAMKTVRSFAALYGLNPADRVRLEVKPPQPETAKKLKYFPDC